MRTKDFVAAIEAGFRMAYNSDACTQTVPHVDPRTGEHTHCLGFLLTTQEHFAVVVAHAAHWVAEDPDLVFQHGGADTQAGILDTLEGFHNLVAGMRVARFMDWTCIHFPGLTEEQVLGSSEAGYDPDLITDTDKGRDPLTGANFDHSQETQP